MENAPLRDFSRGGGEDRRTHAYSERGKKMPVDVSHYQDIPSHWFDSTTLSGRRSVYTICAPYLCINTNVRCPQNIPKTANTTVHARGKIPVP